MNCRNFWEEKAIDMGESGKDNIYGLGRIEAPSLDVPIVRSPSKR